MIPEAPPAPAASGCVKAPACAAPPPPPRAQLGIDKLDPSFLSRESAVVQNYVHDPLVYTGETVSGPSASHAGGVPG